jgi:hypothetical protein
MALTYRGTKGSPLTIAEIDSNFAYFTGSHSITGSLTISGALYTTEPLVITGSLLPVDSGGTALGDPELYFGELYLSTASVNFMGQPNSLVASIKAFGEGDTYYTPASGMVYIAPWYTSGSSVVPKLLRGSFGVGTGSLAIGTSSVTLGRYLSAFGNHQTVVGAFNRTSSADFAFIIGNGTSTLNRSNLLFASASQVQITGSLIVSGTAALSGDISFTTSGSGVVQTLTNIIPTGTASFVSGTNLIDNTNTTTYLNYGINLIETITSQSYCVRLPLVPKTGKQVTIVNLSGADLWVFPSIDGGDIGGDVNGYISIPSDGQSYVFNCYENPLPGGWSYVVNANGSQTYLTGIITSSIGSWNNSTSGSSVLAYINNTTKISGSGNVHQTQNSFDAWPVQYGLIGAQDSFVGSYYLPDQTWKRINSITIYTNITGSQRTNLIPGYTQNVNQFFFYQAGTTTVPNYNYWEDSAWNTFQSTTYNTWVATNVSTDTFWGTYSTGWVGGHTPSVVPGTFVPITPGSVYSTTVGGPGTAKYTMFFNPNVTTNQIGKMIGKSLVGTYYSPVLGYSVDVYTKRYFGFLIKNYSNSINQIQVQARLNLTLA